MREDYDISNYKVYNSIMGNIFIIKDFVGRFMKKLVCVFIILHMCVCLVSPNPVCAADRPAQTELYSLSAAMIDGDTGRVLYEKNGYDIRAMASTTKIMTLILALEYGNTDDVVTVSSYAAKMPDVQLGICEGEQYYLQDLIYSMMLESHNDSAVAIAEHIGGDVEHFADMMNAKAAELGLSDTYFITPNGLDAEDKNGKHSTTAVELAKIMKYCVMDSPAKDQFLTICQTRSYSFTDYSGKRQFTVNNKNRFLDMMTGVLAGKTGFTADAGYCYVAALEQDGKTYIIALLGCGWPGNKGYKWQDSRALFEYGLSAYEIQTILTNDYETEDIAVVNGIGKDSIKTYINANEEFLISQDDNVELVTHLPDALSAPVVENDIVGTIDIKINGQLLSTVNVYAAESVKKVNFPYYLKWIWQSFLF